MNNLITSPSNISHRWRCTAMLFLFCLFAFNAKAQPSFCVGTTSGSTSVTINVTVENFNDIVAFQFPLKYDANVLQFDTLEGIGVPTIAFADHPSVGEIRVSWFDPGGFGQTLANQATAFSVTFNVLSNSFAAIEILENSSLLFPPMEMEVVDSDLNIFTANQINTKPGAINGAPIELSGNIYHDLNLNCQKEANEPLLDNLILKIENPSSTKFTSTNVNGNYRLLLNTGNYSVIPQFDNAYWSSCQTSYDIELMPGISEVTLDIPHQAVIPCPQLAVDLTSPFIQKCTETEYTISYCNKGTADAIGAYVEVEFDSYLTVTSSDIPFSNQSGNHYTFDLGNIARGDCGNFDVQLTVSCDVEDGVTHCSKAQIFPNEFCTPPSPDWSGASIDVTGFCNSTNDSIHFQITNIGGEPMQDEPQYIVIEDAVMMLTQPDVPPLDAGESQTISIPAAGTTVRMEVEQVANHPGISIPSITVEGCGINNSGTFSKGFVNQFPQNENNAFIAYDCRENTETITFSQKQTFPKGYGNQNFVEANSDIEYLIRFQNAEVDSVSNVFIVDTLSEFLDATTLRIGGSSHPMEYEVTNEGIVIFRFRNIKLPSNTLNELESIGYVQFKIAQMPDLPIGTIITNKSIVLMDSDIPIYSNSVFHTIGEDFISVNTHELYLPNITVETFPNPFRDVVQFEIKGDSFNKIQLDIYDLTGRLVRTATHSNNLFTFSRNNLSDGLYIYRLIGDDQLISTGKITIQ